ncbi:MAG: DUF111 family protein [Bacillaceae bacterium]|nr:DUF111 family protein [Bacillaceae bacterium]
MERFNHGQEHQDPGMWKLEVNLDDMTGEQMGYVLDILLENGANDAYYTPIVMKKNRPAYMLTVLVSEQKKKPMVDILFRETTTLGVRYYPVEVHRLERKSIPVKTDWGEVQVKIGVFQGEIVQYAPEYDDCIRIARERGIPLKKVYEIVKKEAVSQLPELSTYFQS